MAQSSQANGGQLEEKSQKTNSTPSSSGNRRMDSQLSQGLDPITLEQRQMQNLVEASATAFPGGGANIEMQYPFGPTFLDPTLLNMNDFQLRDALAEEFNRQNGSGPGPATVGGIGDDPFPFASGRHSRREDHAPYRRHSHAIMSLTTQIQELQTKVDTLVYENHNLRVKMHYQKKFCQFLNARSQRMQEDLEEIKTILRQNSSARKNAPFEEDYFAHLQRTPGNPIPIPMGDFRNGTPGQSNPFNDDPFPGGPHMG